MRPGVMEGLRRKYEGGEKGALLKVINICAHEGCPLPAWAAKAFRTTYTATIHDLQFASWDDVFGKPHPKHMKLHAERQSRELGLGVWARVIELRKKTPHHDVFPDVAKEFGISHAVTKKYFYRLKRGFKGLKGMDPTSKAELAAHAFRTDPAVTNLKSK